MKFEYIFILVLIFLVYVSLNLYSSYERIIFWLFIGVLLLGYFFADSWIHINALGVLILMVSLYSISALTTQLPINTRLGAVFAFLICFVFAALFTLRYAKAEGKNNTKIDSAKAKKQTSKISLKKTTQKQL